MSIIRNFFIVSLFFTFLLPYNIAKGENDYPFQRYQKLSADETYAIVNINQNKNKVYIISVDGKSTRYDNVAYIRNTYYPLEIKIRAGMHRISFGINGINIPEWEVEVNAVAGKIYHFEVNAGNNEINNISSLKPVLEIRDLAPP